MGVGERVVHADIGEATDEDERRRLESAQDDLEFRPDEAGVTPLHDVELVIMRT